MSSSWKQVPRPGDIVWCHFPNYDPKDATMKERPALVMSVMDGRSPILLRVAYGTSQKPRPVRAGSFLLEHPDHLRIAGLWKPTRFDLKNLVVLPYTLGAFVNAPGESGTTRASPILGALHAGCFPEMLRAAKEAGLGRKK